MWVPIDLFTSDVIPGLITFLYLQLRDQIIENYELRRTKPDTGHLCEPDYNIIKNWRYDSNITGDYDEFLTVQGWNDQKFLAKQYQRILPNVLETIYSADKFLVTDNSEIGVLLFQLTFLFLLLLVSSYAHATNRRQFQSVCRRTLRRKRVFAHPG